MHPSCNYVQLAYSGCNTYVYPGGTRSRQVYRVLPADEDDEGGAQQSGL